MPRKPRYEEAGAAHHVWARGVNKVAIFLSDLDRRLYLLGLRSVIEEHAWELFAYCLMTNHIHLLVRTPEPNLGIGMHRLHSAYAQAFNERHGRVGHLFQDRYGSTRVWTDEQLVSTEEYIAMNPVRAGLSATPDGWQWGSRAAAAGRYPPKWLAAVPDACGQLTATAA